MLGKVAFGCSEVMKRNSIGGTDKCQDSIITAVGFRSVFGKSTYRMRFIPEAVVITYWPNQKQQTAEYKETVATFLIFRMQEGHIRQKELNN
jgi:hypothetical protein